jgi:hypothetical protein
VRFTGSDAEAGKMYVRLARAFHLPGQSRTGTPYNISSYEIVFILIEVIKIGIKLYKWRLSTIR